MMTPVWLMLLVRSISKRELVGAIAWVTTPALIGPVMGPPVGGFITTYASWHWIFLINVPIGILGIVLATRYIPDLRAEQHERFDVKGIILAGLGIAGLAFGLSVAGLNFLPWQAVAALIVLGIIFTTAYVIHARRTTSPALDLTLFKLPTFYASVVGGFLFRLGLGALPFLLPLLLQVGFGMTPFQSGLITFATALGSMSMKMVATTALRRLGFKTILVVNTMISAAFLAACAAFTAYTPIYAMVAVLLIGGFFRSLQFTSINTIAYAEVDPARVGKATALMAVGQQLSLSAGVAIGALAVETTVGLRGQPGIQASDFPPAFLLVALVSACATLVFLRLSPDAGAELANRMPDPAGNPAEARDQKIN
jgi:MFS family permease